MVVQARNWRRPGPPSPPAGPPATAHPNIRWISAEVSPGVERSHQDTRPAKTNPARSRPRSPDTPDRSDDQHRELATDAAEVFGGSEVSESRRLAWCSRSVSGLWPRRSAATSAKCCVRTSRPDPSIALRQRAAHEASVSSSSTPTHSSTPAQQRPLDRAVSDGSARSARDFGPSLQAATRILIIFGQLGPTLGSLPVGQPASEGRTSSGVQQDGLRATDYQSTPASCRGVDDSAPRGSSHMATAFGLVGRRARSLGSRGATSWGGHSPIGTTGGACASGRAPGGKRRCVASNCRDSSGRPSGNDTGRDILDLRGTGRDGTSS
jgi:hypothetical protein